MIIQSGETVTIKARVSANSGGFGGSITWGPATQGDERAETIARVVNANDVLLAACKSVFAGSQAKADSRRKWTVTDQEDYETLRVAISKAEGRP